jgi:hypothetical protein
MQNNNMAEERKFTSAYSLSAVTNEPLEIDMSNLEWRLSIIVLTNYERNIVF